MKRKLMMYGIMVCILFAMMEIKVNANDTSIAKSAEGVYLMEATTGAVLYERNSDRKLYPASMTKMMGLLLVFEAIHDGDLKWDDEVIASEHAASMGGSQIFLEPNEAMSVSDLMKAICIGSANDAMVAMAEKISGTHEHFVSLMNAKAKELGLTHTHFMNATGLHDQEHYSSAKDMALIAQALIQEGGDELLSITSTYDAYIREQKEKFWLVNTNKLLKQYPGVDGLKTGFTQEAMSCITVTAKKDHVRLIGVLMKEPSAKQRNIEAKQLLDYGFSLMSQGILKKQGAVIETHYFKRGKPSQATLVLKDDLIAVYPKGKKPKIVSEKVIIKKELPYQKGDVIGTITLHLDNDTQVTGELLVKETIQKQNYFDLLQHTLKTLFFI